MASATEILRDEHRVILRAIDLLERGAGKLERGHAPSEAWWQALRQWVSAFADRNHHAKEEQHLFPALARAGVPVAGGPITVLLEEHTEGRSLLAEMGMSDPRRRVAAARLYCCLLREHIDKENNVLFPMSDAVLGPAEQAALARQFEAVELEQGLAASVADAEARLDCLAADLDAARFGVTTAVRPP